VTRRPPELILTTAPFLHDPAGTPRIMLEVVAASLLVVGAACWTFGFGALLVIGAATVGAVVTEWFFSRKAEVSPLRDFSAVLTGILLGLTLPPGFPLWMAFLGGVSGIGLGKLIWGGLGQNIFNPALVGRAFLQSAFPTAITTWNPPAEEGARLAVPASQFATPMMQADVDVVTAATPLGLAKFENEITDQVLLFFGNTGGSLGETNAALLLALGIWLGARRIFDWRLPVSTLLSVAVFAWILNMIDAEAYPGPMFMVLSGGLFFGAIFMVTDPVTTPTTPRGAWIYGIGVGVLVVLIRIWGGLPEGVMYAILLMNAATPHINRYTQPRPFGG
jgi:electron transport complex protein RnfD